MLKKKIAVFASGWSSQILCEYLQGMSRALEGKNVDIFAFVAYPPGKDYRDLVVREFNIFNLPELTQYDGLIVFSSTISDMEVLENLLKKCVKSGVPTISHGYKYSGTVYSSVNNDSGMRKLVEHLIDDHKIKRPAFIAGTAESEDSSIRFNVFKQVLGEKNIEFNEEYFAYTQWDNYNAIQFVHKLKDSGIEMPDAFVCANDGLAMATVMELNKMGYEVPEDIIVTGFDFILDSQRFYPSISSVNQQFEELGFEGASFILDECMGKKSGKTEITVPCKFMSGESCGCAFSRDNEKIRRLAGRDAFYTRMYDNFTERTLNTFEREIVSSKSLKDLSDRFVNLITEKKLMSIDTLHICVQPAAFIPNNNSMVQEAGYPETMQVLFSMEEKVLNNATVCPSREIFPNYKYDEINHVYIVLPLGDDYNTLGYVVTRDCLQNLAVRTTQKYQSRLNFSLQKYRQSQNLSQINGQLSQMVHKDSLTSVKNRAAYEEDIEDLNRSLNKNPNMDVGIVMFDINDLKMVNDKYGHEAGDEYIIHSTRFICSVFTHSPIYRIGGDEFVCILMGRDFNSRDKLLLNMKEIMASIKDSQNVTPTKRISIATGMAVFEAGLDKSIMDVFKRADKLMYEDKKLMKGISK